jgi:integral membrane protein (TIGR01906 family)
MKILRYSGLTILNIGLFFVLLFSAVQIISTWDAYYSWHYETHGIEETTKMNDEHFMEVTNKMMDYLMGRRDSLDMKAEIDGEIQEVFGEREKAHMIDVKSLFVSGRIIRNISAIILFVFITTSFFLKPKLFFGWIQSLKAFFITSFLLIGFLGALFYFNFSKYFIIFHKIFFNNDLWILDPKTDVLINMVPEIFFFQTTMLIVALFVIMVLGVMIIRKLLMSEMVKNWRA